MSKTIIAFLAVALGFGACSVRAGNPGTGTGKFSLAGVVIGIEDEKPIPDVAIRVKDHNGNVVGTSASDQDGQYEIENLEDGEYVIEIGESYSRTITLAADEQLVYILDIVLPVPSAPSNFRSVGNHFRRFCLQWKDNSQIETGFHIRGPRKLDFLANEEFHQEQIDDWTWVDHRYGSPLTMPWGDVNAVVDQWNERFAGTYFIWAYNQYGSSVSTSIEVAPFDYRQEPDYPEIECQP